MRLQRLAIILLCLGLCLSAATARAQSSPTLVSVTLDPTVVTGGSAATGTVTLSQAAPAGGVVVLLASSNPAIVTVPPQVTVGPGARTQTFPVATRPVTAATPVIVSAVQNGVTRSAALTVQPTPGPAGATLEVPAAVPVSGQLGSPRPPRAAAAAADTVLPERGTGGGPGGAGGPDEGRDDSAIRRFTDDGSLFVADTAGTALLRLRAAAREILLDPTARDPLDGAGLARLLRVETGRSGVSAVLALRADNVRGLYRLDPSPAGRPVLQRLALLPDETSIPFGSELFAIGDTGEVAFVTSAAPASNLLALFQVAGDQRVQLLGPGQMVVDSAGKVVVDGARLSRFSSLQSNGSGDLVFGIDLPYGAAVLHKTRVGLAVVAATGQIVPRGRGSGVTARLTTMARPRIGPDGTVVFLGGGTSFVNFFVARPGGAPEPLLNDSGWDSTAASFDYEVGEGGRVAIRATRAPDDPSRLPGPSELYVVGPSGDVARVDLGRLQPQGRPVFGGSGVFFLAADPDLPSDGAGNRPMGLYRIQFSKGGSLGPPEAVAVPGQAVPGKLGVRLLTVPRRPAESTQGVAFEAQFGSPGPGAIPQSGYFQVPLDGAFTSGTLLGDEGAPLPGAERLVLLRTLSYGVDGTLVFGGLQPGAGPLVASLTAAVTASRTRTQSVQAAVEPLLAIGQPLDRPDRQLLAIRSPPIALGQSQQLFAARFSQNGGPSGEGLFTIDRNRLVQAVAVTGDPAPGLPGARFAGFADAPSAGTPTATTCSPFAATADPGALGSPSVFTDGDRSNAVFKARLERSGATSLGVFQWNGSVVTVVGLSDPDPDQDPLKRSADDRRPYQLLRWAAGPAGRAYLMEQHQSAAGTQTVCLLERSTAGLRALAVSGVTPTAGGRPGILTDLLNFVTTRDGSVFVHGRASGEGVFRAEPDRLMPVAMLGDPVPRFADGRQARDLVFSSGILRDSPSSFGLMPDSARGGLLFRGHVSQGRSPEELRGLFRLSPQGDVEAIIVEGLDVTGARDLAIGTLSDSLDQQTANGTTVYAMLQRQGGWTLFRVRTTREATGKVSFTTAPIAQERAGLPGVPSFPTLDPARVLDLPCRSGPLFSLNDAGHVACMASDGQRWGIYLFPDRQ